MPILAGVLVTAMRAARKLRGHSTSTELAAFIKHVADTLISPPMYLAQKEEFDGARNRASPPGVVMAKRHTVILVVCRPGNRSPKMAERGLAGGKRN